MIIDTHCHVYPDKIAQKAAEATGHFYGIPPRMDGTVEALKQASQQVGIGHSVINSVATTAHQVSSINRYIAATVAENSGRMTGLGTLHPDSEDPERDIDQILSLGLKGIKLHPEIQGFCIDDPRILRFFEIAGERLPFLLHLGDKRYDKSNPNRMKKVLESFPHVRFIGAHFAGWSIWEDATYELKGYDNLVADSSSSLYAISPEKAVELIHAFGAERILFGTDYPLMSPVEEMERFDRLELTAQEREKILWRNAAEYYKISL